MLSRAIALATITAVVTSSCCTQPKRPETQVATERAAAEAPLAAEETAVLQQAQPSNAIQFTAAAHKTAAAKKNACPKHGTFDLSCDAGDLYIGVEPMQHTIDEKCSVEGTAGDDAARALEYRTKNNLCLTGSPVDVNLHDFLDLQADLTTSCPDVPLGNHDVSPTGEQRACLTDIRKHASKPLGEGTLVRFVAFINIIRPNSGEGVNCDCTGREQNDMHISLVGNKGDEECSGIVAEMIPHFRPEEWTKPNLDKALAKQHPVRVEGPLFADVRHLEKPCGEVGRQGDPARSSVWEIHPIKRFQVCHFATKAKCSADNDSVWEELQPEPAEPN